MKSRKKTILLVEDDLGTTLVETHLLKSFGYEVVAAKSGEEALQIATGNAKIDLILMDIELGSGLDGTEAARQILGKRNLPIVFISSHTDPEYLERIKGIAGYGFVVKNSGKVVLQSSIEMAFNLFELQAVLRASEAQYRTLFEQVQDAVWILDLAEEYAGQILLANAAAAKMHGYTIAEMETLRITDLDIPESLSKAPERFGIIKTGESISGETQHVRKDGTVFPVEFSAGPIRFAGRSCVLAFSRDITERKRAEAEKATLENELQQAHKLELVGRLAGGVAHDFNNILGVIMGYTEINLKQVDPAQPLHADLMEIRKAAKRAADLTRQLLTFARKQAVAPEVLDLNATVAGMLKMLQRLIGENILLAWQPAPDLWPVKVDSSQLDQILTNLCVNARDSIADVGTITIDTGNSSFDAKYCADHAGFVPGEYVRLSVSDNGCGVDKGTLAHIFEPFFSTKGVGKGVGLGLATVDGAVKQNNGFINIHSEPGQGTELEIYLPRHKGKVTQLLQEDPAAPAARGHATILLVEDEPNILKTVRLLLEKQGYAVLVASASDEAIRLAGEYAGEIHLLITDVVMPEMNGRDLAKKLLLLYPRLKCLFMSGYTSDIIAQHGVLDEGVNFIQKPFSSNDLIAKVRKVLDG